jgi:hypothetical protein
VTCLSYFHLVVIIVVIIVGKKDCLCMTNACCLILKPKQHDHAIS